MASLRRVRDEEVPGLVEKLGGLFVTGTHVGVEVAHRLAIAALDVVNVGVGAQIQQPPIQVDPLFRDLGPQGVRPLPDGTESSRRRALRRPPGCPPDGHTNV